MTDEPEEHLTMEKARARIKRIVDAIPFFCSAEERHQMFLMTNKIAVQDRTKEETLELMEYIKTLTSERARMSRGISPN